MFARRTFIATALLSMAGLSTITLTGCSDPETPTEVAVAFVKAMYEGDTDTALKYVDFEDHDSAEVKLVEGKISAAVAEAKDEAKKRGGIKRIDTSDPKETVKDIVHVDCRVIFGDGSKKLEDVRLTKKGATWKIMI